VPDEFLLADETATEGLGFDLGQRLAPGTTLILLGQLGAGKTTLVRGLARALESSASVASPTYAYIHEYPTPQGPLVHVDAYRLEKPGRLWQMGLQELLERARLTVIEWGEGLIADLEEPVVVRLEMAGSGRRATVEGA
jgi:tRNA threonylcarbamoyladenosine biosynthesis protein TsaE